MTEPGEFRSSISATFAVDALGNSDGGGWRDTITREYRLAGGTPLIHARPDGDDITARLVIVPSLRGHNAMFSDLCTRLAQRHGYEVISPELFPGRQHLDESGRIAACITMDDDAVIDDMIDAAKLLSPGPMIAMGFCLGGMFAMKALARGPFEGAVAFYGFIRLPPAWQREGRDEPLAAVARGCKPVLGLYGAQDALDSAEDIDALVATGGDVTRFEHAGHAFAHDPLLPSYRPDDAAAAWRTAQAFITRLSQHDR